MGDKNTPDLLGMLEYLKRENFYIAAFVNDYANQCKKQRPHDISARASVITAGYHTYRGLEANGPVPNVSGNLIHSVIKSMEDSLRKTNTSGEKVLEIICGLVNATREVEELEKLIKL